MGARRGGEGEGEGEGEGDTPPVLSCEEGLDCVQDCALVGDAGACLDECEERVSAAAQDLFDEVVACLFQHCADVWGDEELVVGCAAASCPAEQDACEAGVED